MQCTVKDSSIYPIPGSEHMLHIGTILRGLQEFVVMLCVRGPHSGKCYIEELVPNMVNFSEDVYGNLKFIQDDDLANELAQFAHHKGLTNLKERVGQMIETGLKFY